jgi:hypothetical protein
MIRNIFFCLPFSLRFNLKDMKQEWNISVHKFETIHIFQDFENLLIIYIYIYIGYWFTYLKIATGNTSKGVTDGKSLETINHSVIII